jgi:hypothetical protein
VFFLTHDEHNRGEFVACGAFAGFVRGHFGPQCDPKGTTSKRRPFWPLGRILIGAETPRAKVVVLDLELELLQN